MLVLSAAINDLVDVIYIQYVAQLVRAEICNTHQSGSSDKPCCFDFLLCP